MNIIGVYIVEEETWDHHQNVKVFSSYKTAELFCNENYEVDPVMHPTKGWKKNGLFYSIEYYELNE